MSRLLGTLSHVPSFSVHPTCASRSGSTRSTPVDCTTVATKGTGRYGHDVLAGDWRRPKKDTVPEIPLSRDLVVEDADETFCGAVVAWDKATVTLEDRAGRLRIFELGPASFLVDGKPVTLVRPASQARKGPLRSASGSVAVPNAPARVARESRIYVEGAHDAELVEKVWGHDLRVEGVVVEFLEGVDDLPSIVAEFAPGPGGAWAFSWTIWSRAPRRAASPSGSVENTSWSPDTPMWMSGRPYVLAPSGSSAGPRCHAAHLGKKESYMHWVGRWRPVRRGVEFLVRSVPMLIWNPLFWGGSKNSSTS